MRIDRRDQFHHGALTDSGRAGGGSGRLAQPIEARAELLVEDRRLAVEDERARRQLGDGRRDVTEAASVIDAGAADETNRVAILVRDDSPAIDLLLIDLARAVERLSDERRGHRRVPENHDRDPRFFAIKDAMRPRRTPHTTTATAKPIRASPNR